MLDPSGPLPPAVYWRRRALALGAAALAAVLAGWGAVALLDGPAEPPAPVAAPPPPPEALAAEPAPPPCPDSALRIAAEVARPEFRADERVEFTAVLTNVGDTGCVRDTNRMLREVVVHTAEGERVWSSADCAIESTNELPVLEPGGAVRHEITWTGRGSVPGCAAAGEPVPSGEYQVTARLDGITSAPAPFRITPAAQA
ncbi:hypothetical protein [Saccharopolyspora cebuensis]|uniref:Intracellular proteinase inhibitor BsuPI domain-containing protein n=1 Tax=Saccharopolyspora cebuensis TaxID=418759 RepID=A0ABV4CMB5_9PSEU